MSSSARSPVGQECGIHHFFAVVVLIPNTWVVPTLAHTQKCPLFRTVSQQRPNSCPTLRCSDPICSKLGKYLHLQFHNHLTSIPFSILPSPNGLHKLQTVGQQTVLQLGSSMRRFGGSVFVGEMLLEFSRKFFTFNKNSISLTKADISRLYCDI